MGFEVRLFSRMGVAEIPKDALGPLPCRWSLAIAAAVVALGIGLGVGWSTGPGQPGPSEATGTPVASVNLVADGHTVGHVVALRREQALDADVPGRFDGAGAGHLRGDHG